jgi:hypothetical protein
MRRFLVVLALLSLAASLPADEGKVNFSGEWTFNEGKSELGEGRWRQPISMTVKHTGNDISIARTAQGRDGAPVADSESLTLDGKEHKSETRNSPRTSTAKWSESGETVTISSKVILNRDGNEFEITTVEVWSLQDGGAVLSIAQTSQTPRGERKRTLVYSKKKAAE